MIKCVLIDPVGQELTPHEFRKITHKEITGLLQCQTMALLGELPSGDLVWVDDNGFLRDGPQPTFTWPMVRPLPVFGRGVITGPENFQGNITGIVMETRDMRIYYTGLMICRGFETTESTIYMPGIGPVATLTSTPILERV